MQRNRTLFFVLSLIAIIILLGITNYLGLFDGIHFLIGPFVSNHWMSILGASYIAVSVPLQHYLRTHNQNRYGTLMKFHVYGNLISIGFITIHFSQQIKLPHFGTGLALYLSLIFSVLTGVLLRFGFAKSRRSWWRYIHTGLIIGFYIIITVHVLKGLHII
jgi:pilus assembly protein TadC